MNERRIVEDTTEEEIQERNNFDELCAELTSQQSENTTKKTLIAKLIIKWQKKQVQKTPIKYNYPVKDAIDEKMDWENFKNEEVDDVKLSPIPVSVKTGEEVLKMNKRGLTSIQTVDAVKKIREYDFKLGLQMMVGMYGSEVPMGEYTKW